jgi:hypothetical protein
MAERPKQDEPPSLDKEAFEEALDAAEVFSELADDEAAGREQAAGEKALDAAGDEFGAIGDASGAIGDPFADEFELAAHRPTALAEEHPAPAPQAEEADAAGPEPAAEVPVAQPVPAFARAASQASIGDLFKPVVKHSPPSKMRIEAESVGALFRRFIEQE